MVLLPYFFRHKVTTIYELLEQRFNVAVRMLAVAIFMLLRLIWMGMVVYTASFALVEVTGWRLPTIIIGVAIVGTFYTWLGGVRAVMWTDVVQWFALFGGSLFCIGYVMYQWLNCPNPFFIAGAVCRSSPQPLSGR